MPQNLSWERWITSVNPPCNLFRFLAAGTLSLYIILGWKVLVVAPEQPTPPSPIRRTRLLLFQDKLWLWLQHLLNIFQVILTVIWGFGVLYHVYKWGVNLTLACACTKAESVFVCQDMIHCLAYTGTLWCCIFSQPFCNWPYFCYIILPGDKFNNTDN